MSKKSGLLYSLQKSFGIEPFTRIYLLLMLCVFPLYISYEKYTNVTKHKAYFFFITTILFLVSICLIHLTHIGNGKKHKQNKFFSTFSFFEWALLVFVFITILAAVVSPYRKYVFAGAPERYDGLLTTLLYAGAFFALLHYYKPRDLDFLLFAVSAMLVSIIGILQYFGADIFALFPYDKVPGYTAKTILFRTTLGNIDIVSSYTSLIVLFFGILYVKSNSKYRFAYLAAGALNIYLMLIAGAEAGMIGSLAAFVLAIPFIITDYKSIYRTCFLGFVYCLMVYLFNLTNVLSAETIASVPLLGILKSKWLIASLVLLIVGAAVFGIGRHIKINLSSKMMRIIGVVIMVIVILAGFAFVEIVGRDSSSGSLYEAREIMHGQLDDEFGTYRGFVWNRALALLKNDTSLGQLLIGSGPDTFGNRFKTYKAESQELLNVSYDKAHNEYLQILFCQGILGLVAYIAFLIALFMNAIPRAFDQPLLLAAGLASVSYIVQAFFSISVPIVTPLFWVMLAIMAVFCKDVKSNDGANHSAPR